MSSFQLNAARGDTIRLLIAVTRPDAAGVEQPINLTGATLYFTAKRNVADADDALTTIQKVSGAGIELLDAAAGTALVTLDPADTEGLTARTVFVCDVELVEVDGVVTTISEGHLMVTLDVTRA